MRGLSPVRIVVMKNVKHQALLSVLLLTCVCAAQGPAGLRISGAGMRTIEVTSADLHKMTRLSVDIHEVHSGAARHYEGVRLSDLLAKAGAPLGENLKGKTLATYVMARARDGYAVVYSLAELDPVMNDNQIIVADSMDGKPLDLQQGPFRVIVPGEKRPARWIRMVTSFELSNPLSPSESSPL